MLVGRGFTVLSLCVGLRISLASLLSILFDYFFFFPFPLFVFVLFVEGEDEFEGR